MFEIREFGTPNGIFWVLLIFCVSGLEVGIRGFLWSNQLLKIRSAASISRVATLNVIKLTSFFTIILGIFIFINYSSPLVLGIDRVSYWNQIVPQGLHFFPTLFLQSFYFVAFLYWFYSNEDKRGLYPLILLLSYVVLTILVLGQKFSAFIFYCNIWLIVVVGFFPRIKIKKKTVFWTFSIIIFLFGSVSLSYFHYGKDILFILQRIALQSQLLWSVFNEDYIQILPSKEVVCFFGCEQFQNGWDYISYKYLPKDLYSFYSKNETVLSGFTPALQILTLGIPLAFIFHIVFSMFLGLMQSRVLFYIKEKNFLYSLILLKVFLGLTLFWLTAMVSTLLGVILCFLLLILYRILPRQRNNIFYNSI